MPPIVVITSNRTRDVHDALKRRCLYHWVEHPDFEREVAIVAPAGPRGRCRRWPARWRPRSRQLREHRALQAARGGRDDRLGRGPGRPRARPSSTSATVDAHPRHRPQVPGGPGAGARRRPRRPGRGRAPRRMTAGARAAGRPGPTQTADRPDRWPSRSPGCCAAPAWPCRSASVDHSSPRPWRWSASTDRTGVYWAGRATLVRRPEDIATYDRVFAVVLARPAPTVAGAGRRPRRR